MVAMQKQCDIHFLSVNFVANCYSFHWQEVNITVHSYSIQVAGNYMVQTENKHHVVFIHYWTDYLWKQSKQYVVYFQSVSNNFLHAYNIHNHISVKPINQFFYCMHSLKEALLFN